MFSRYYLPGYRAGGAIRSVANMVGRLGDEFEFRIVTLDRDMGDESAYDGIPLGTWVAQGKALVRYVSRRSFGLHTVCDIVRDTPHDLVYLNSFFDPLFTQRVLVNRRLGRLLGRPIVIAPHGEFSTGAMRLKYLKKAVFIRLSRALGLYADLIWHASSWLEVEDIERVMSVGVSSNSSERPPLGGRVAVALDLSPLPGLSEFYQGESPPRANEAIRICFLSRISPMKNLDYALRVLALVRVSVDFSIYGPTEDRPYWAECLELIRALPAHIQVTYKGEVDPSKVVDRLAGHDLFLLPTRGENFGHVIQEALRAGLPLLISDQTPWQELEEQRVGWGLPLSDPEAFARRVEEVAGWSPLKMDGVRARARALASRMVDDPATLEANRRVFLDAIEEYSRPPTNVRGV